MISWANFKPYLFFLNMDTCILQGWKKSILCSANLVSVRFPSIFCVIKGPIFRIGNLHCSLLQILHYSDIYVPRVLSISSTFHFFRFTFLGRVNRMIVKKFRTTWYTRTWKRLAFRFLFNMVCVCASERRWHNIVVCYITFAFERYILPFLFHYLWFSFVIATVPLCASEICRLDTWC